MAAPARPALLLVNPAAGRGRAAAQAASCEDALTRAGHFVTVRLTESLEDARQQAAGWAPGGVVVGLGGDGLHAYAALGASEGGAQYLPLPGGRGNDICRQLGLGGSPGAVAGRIGRLVPRALDIGHVTAGDGAARPFLATVNIGFDAESNALANSFTRSAGVLTYLWAGLITLTRAKEHEFTVTLPGESRAWTSRGWMATVSGLGSCGGGFVLAPQARGDDGLLTLTFHGAGSRVFLVETLARALLRRTFGASRARFEEGETVEIASSAVPALTAYADGDLVGPLPVACRARQAVVEILAAEDAPGLSSPRTP